MSMACSNIAWFRAALGWLLALTLMVGCATRIDWNARIGTYTYDDAVKELGPPDKVATTSDSTTVAEWLTTRGRMHYAAGSVPAGRPSMGYVNGMGLGGEYYSTPDNFLRLTFGADQKLQAVKRLSK